MTTEPAPALSATSDLPTVAAAKPAPAPRPAIDSETTPEAIMRGWNDRRAKAIERMPDYIDVAEREDVPVTTVMAEAIVRSDQGPDVAYHLGKNPSEAKRIARLEPARQVFEVGKLAAAVESEKEAARPRSARELSVSEYAAKRTPQLHRDAQYPKTPMDTYATQRLKQLRSNRIGIFGRGN